MLDAVDLQANLLPRDGTHTLHHSVYTLLADLVRSGALRPGERLPAERTIAEQLKVSRVTVRRALRELARNGLIESSVGRGSFVSGGPVGEPPDAIMSFSEMAAARGLVVTSRVVMARVRPATIDEADRMRIAPGGELFELERVRLLEGIATAIDRSHVPVGRVPGIVDADYSSQSLYGLFYSVGVIPTRSEHALEAIAATPRQAELLEVAVGAPLLHSTEITFDQSGSPINLALIDFRGDRYRFRATTTRGALESQAPLRAADDR